MMKLISYPLSAICYLFFSLTLVVFHPIQWFCFNVFGYQAHKKSVDVFNFVLMKCLHIIGTRYTFNVPENIPENLPTIIVANHQGLYDIPPIIWYMRKFHVKFISKKELGKGIPSVSYNLRHGGSVLINRKNANQALKAIKQMAEYIEKHKRGVVIFPEGTRSKDGKPRAFKSKGLETLIEHTPNGIIIPITINNSWKILRYGKFPYGLGSHLIFTVHDALKISDYKTDELIKITEKVIIQDIIHD